MNSDCGERVQFGLSLEVSGMRPPILPVHPEGIQVEPEGSNRAYVFGLLVGLPTRS